jgi:hypothetical protein
LFGVLEEKGWRRDWEKDSRYRNYWSKAVPEENQAWDEERKCISYDRILALDEVGDAANEGPHLVVEYRNGSDPFEARVWPCVSKGYGWSYREIEAVPEKRISYFPKPVPEIEDQDSEGFAQEA